MSNPEPSANDQILPRATSSLGGQAARAAGHTIWTQGLRALVQIASLIILARLLTDYDYGLIGMFNAVVGLAAVFQDFGLSTAAIQRQTFSREQRSNLWWINTGVSVLISLIIASIGPMLAWFYHEPAMSRVCLALAPFYILDGMCVQYRADLTRSLRIGTLLGWDLASTLISLPAAILAALNGWGYWALIVQRGVAAIVLAIALPVLCRWLPTRYDRTVGMRPLLTFGSHVGVTGLVYYLASNLDSILMGRFFGASTLGLYNRAIQLIRSPLNLIRPQASNLGLSVMSKLINDDDRSMAYLQRGQLLLGYPSILLTAVVVSAAPEITEVVLGPSWVTITPYLRLVVIGESLTTLCSVGNWIYTSRGLGRSYLQYTLLAASLRLVSVIIGAQFGVLGVAWAYALIPAVLWPISLTWSTHAARLAATPLLLNGTRIAALGALSTGATWWLCSSLRGTNSLAVIAASAISACAITALPALFVPAIRRDLAGVRSVIRLFRKR